MTSRSGCSDGVARGDLSPGPFPTRKGERMAFLKVCIPSCFDGFGRMDHAIETQTPSYNPLAKPLTVPPSSQAQAVAYNEA